MIEKAFSVHGHFYQPPREDPFTGSIPQEYGAEPYNDWTERIYHECYLPNAQAVGKSLEGRPIYVQVFGDGEDVLWILATVHGNE